MNLKKHGKCLLLSLLVAGSVLVAGGQATMPAIHASRNSSIREETEMIVSGGGNISHHHFQRNSHGNHKLVRIAKSKSGDRYSYGAVGPHRFDCSGFVRYVFQHSKHITLPRTAQAQYMATAHKRHAKRGRLVFFGSSKHSITHVGICLNHSKMIDAQNSGVKVENIHAPWWHLQGYGQVR